MHHSAPMQSAAPKMHRTVILASHPLVPCPEAERMNLFDNPHAFEYLLEGIASARSLDELTRMRRCAHAHYSGLQLRELEAEIEARARSLLDAASTRAPRRDERTVGG
jgi:hypothetical protein